MVSALLAAGASPSLAHACGPSPLHLAARGGHLAAVQALLGAGASPAAVDGAPTAQQDCTLKASASPMHPP